MLFSEAVVNDLARVWTRLHRAAARTHLEAMIQQMQKSGDSDGMVNYSRVLAAVIAYSDRRAALDAANTKIGSAQAAGAAHRSRPRPGAVAALAGSLTRER